MSSPDTRTFTEDEAIAYDSGLVDGRVAERTRIIKLIEPFAQCDECDAGNKADDCSPKLAQFILELIKGGKK